MYKRFFAFGCSFTNFYWPTWADIIGREFPAADYHNYGLCATGNEFAFHRLTEVHARYNINADDLVIVQWTNFAREDRYRDGAWQTNIFAQNKNSKEWMAQWFDLRGALLKTSSCIAGATHLLETTGCEFHYHSMMPMRQIDQQDTLFTDAEYKDIFAVYQSYYDLINISMVEHLYGSGPKCHNPEPVRIKFREGHKESYIDHHPTPKQHLQYVNEVMLPLLTNPVHISSDTVRWVGDWEDKIRSAVPYFKCSVDGWSFDYRYRKHHGHLC